MKHDFSGVNINPSDSAASNRRRVCTRCVMDTSDPDIQFDSSGVCNHCHHYDASVRSLANSDEAHQQRLVQAIAEMQRDGVGKRYDCTVGVSGGVDSTFLLYKVKQLGLRPLAIHVDNGWNSESAVSNVSAALRHLKIDLHTQVLDWEEFRDLQTAFLKSGVPDCEIPSDHVVIAAVRRAARQYGIRHTVWGYNVRTESHLPSSWSRGHLDWGFASAIHRRYGSRSISSLPTIDFISYVTEFKFTQSTFNLLDYVNYSKTEAVKLLTEQLGWRDPGGKHYENVYTRWYQGCFLPVRFGYDKRRTHLSSRICAGEVLRSEACELLHMPTYDPELQATDTEYVMKKLCLSRSDFTAIMNGPKRTFHDFPSYWKVQHGAAYRATLRLYQFFKYDLRGRRKPTV